MSGEIRGDVQLDPHPILGQRYTISGLPDKDMEIYFGIGPRVLIKNLPNRDTLGMNDWGWSVLRFRPLATQEQDVALIRALVMSAGALEETC